MAKSKSTRTKSRGSSIAGQPKKPRRPKSTGRRAKSETAPREHRPEELIDEETGALSRRPGGTGDASFGGDDEGPEGPAR